jgi:hypothetical protein
VQDIGQIKLDIGACVDVTATYCPISGQFWLTMGTSGLSRWFWGPCRDRLGSGRGDIFFNPGRSLPDHDWSHEDICMVVSVLRKVELSRETQANGHVAGIIASDPAVSLVMHWFSASHM